MVILVRIFLFLFIFSSCDSGGDPNIEGCTDLNATNFNQNANVDDGNCIFSGCVDQYACNYNTLAIDDDGSCIYAQENFDCNDNCMVDIDCAGECGGTAIIDCMGICEGNSFINEACGICSACDLQIGTIIFVEEEELWYNINEDIYGFQFDLYGVTINSISYGNAISSGLIVDYVNGANFSRILGYSSDSSKISEDCGTLIDISFSGQLTNVNNIVFGEILGEQFQVDYQICE
tara:strand:- start:67 stop:768 length:702 start_codon:yes stop_codon:yes gene_type:complete